MKKLLLITLVGMVASCNPLPTEFGLIGSSKKEFLAENTDAEELFKDEYEEEYYEDLWFYSSKIIIDGKLVEQYTEASFDGDGIAYSWFKEFKNINTFVNLRTKYKDVFGEGEQKQIVNRVELGEFQGNLRSITDFWEAYKEVDGVIYKIWVAHYINYDYTNDIAILKNEDTRIKIEKIK